LPAPDSTTERLSVGIRPEHLPLVRTDSDPPAGPRIRGTVVSVEPHGAETHLEVQAEGLELRTRVVGFDAPALGQPATLAIDTVRLRWFDRTTGRAL
jgi:multiple sugar transport system ATP-binding protein